MWVYLSTWLVQDGELPELRRGDLLADYGVRASGWIVDRAAESHELVEQEEPDPDGFATVHYRLSGTVEWSRPETSEATIRCGDLTLLARLTDLERAEVGIGTTVRILCGLAVVPKYEWLAFGLPNVRRTWKVDGIKVERRALERRDDQDVPAQVLALEEVDQIHRWSDETAGQATSYLLNLSPA